MALKIIELVDGHKLRSKELVRGTDIFFVFKRSNIQEKSVVIAFILLKRPNIFWLRYQNVLKEFRDVGKKCKYTWWTFSPRQRSGGFKFFLDFKVSKAKKFCRIF